MTTGARWQRLAGADLSDAQMALNRRSMPSVDFVSVNLESREAFDRTLGGLARSFEAVVAMELIEHVDDLAQASLFHHTGRPSGTHVRVTGRMSR